MCGRWCGVHLITRATSSTLRRLRHRVRLILPEYRRPIPMNIAFSTVSAPKWDFETIVARAKEYGYDGVEIRGGLNETVLTSSNIFLSDVKKVRDVFDGAGITVACLSSSIAM